MRETIHLSTDARETLVDITAQVRAAVARSGVRNGLVSVYARGATAAVMIQENRDESVQTDVVNLLRQLIPRGVWLHDRQDGNGDAHLKAGLVGPSEKVPVIDGELGLSRWQNIFFCEFADRIEARRAGRGGSPTRCARSSCHKMAPVCEFDGPRPDRQVVCTVIADPDI
jgi:secondary thiamine-phosphate synthase enzyme